MTLRGVKRRVGVKKLVDEPREEDSKGPWREKKTRKSRAQITKNSGKGGLFAKGYGDSIKKTTKGGKKKKAKEGKETNPLQG